MPDALGMSKQYQNSRKAIINWQASAAIGVDLLVAHRGEMFITKTANTSQRRMQSISSVVLGAVPNDVPLLQHRKVHVDGRGDFRLSRSTFPGGADKDSGLRRAMKVMRLFVLLIRNRWSWQYRIGNNQALAISQTLVKLPLRFGFAVSRPSRLRLECTAPELT